MHLRAVRGGSSDAFESTVIGSIRHIKFIGKIEDMSKDTDIETIHIERQLVVHMQVLNRVAGDLPGLTTIARIGARLRIIIGIVIIIPTTL